MVRTKYGFLKVICEGCNAEEFVPFIKNRDKDKCDICGQIKNRVTYEDA